MYTTDGSILHKRTIVDLIEILNPTAKIYLSRSAGSSNYWRDFQRSLKGPPAEEVTLKNDLFNLEVSSGAVSEYFVDADKKLSLDLSAAKCGIHDKIYDAVSNIATDIRRSFVTSEFSISIGWHDIFEFMEHEEGYLFGRASLSLSFWGWLYPSPDFADVVVNLPELKGFALDLEPILGPLSTCFYTGC
jgi:hypothetical protein